MVPAWDLELDPVCIYCTCLLPRNANDFSAKGFKESQAHRLFVGTGPHPLPIRKNRLIVHLHYLSLTRSSLCVAGRGLPFLADGMGGGVGEKI